MPVKTAVAKKSSSSLNDEGPIKRHQKKIITDKAEKNPNKPEVKRFPDNIPASDYVTIEEKKFKKMLVQKN